MDLFFKAINLICTGVSFVLVIFAVLRFRKERLFKPFALLISVFLSAILLPVYFSISGIRLNFALGFVIFTLGLGLGVISGGTAKLRPDTKGVMGKQSWIAFLIWGLSLVFSMLLNLTNSTTASALGALPLCFTTGIQVSSNMILAFRTLRLGRLRPAGLGR